MAKRLHLALLLLVALLAASHPLVTPATAVPLDPSQAAVLAECQQQWQAPLPGWAAGGECSTVYGVECDDAGMIVFMNITGVILAGPIPTSIASLTALAFLQLVFTQLTGPILPALSTLRSLESLELSANNFTGPIPPGIGALVHLTYLRFADNGGLSGTIPASISNLTALTHLDLSYNEITGSIPVGFSALSELKVMGLSYMNLTGPFPDWVSGQTTLIYMSLVGNRISGPLPDSIGSAINLKSFSIWQNLLSGSIPESIGSLTKLAFLHLYSNNLTDGIPEGIGNMKDITSLDLSYNQLSGSMPSTLSRLASLQYLYLRSNEFDGSLPSWIAAMSDLQHLDLSVNLFSGYLPTSLCQLQWLSYLNVSSTSLACPVKASSCNKNLILNSTFCDHCPAFCSSCSTAAAAAPPPSPPSPPPSLPPSPSPSPPSTSGLSTGAVVGIVVAAALLLLLLAAAAWWLVVRTRKQPSEASPVSGLDNSKAALHQLFTPLVPSTITSTSGATGASSGNSLASFQQFSLEAVAQATRNWDAANELGSGGYGDVYRGVSPLDGCTPWAVKRAKVITNDFKREVTQMASKHHPHLVRLLGFAVGGDVNTRVENVLVYEYIANGDLERWMGADAPAPLTLQQRLDILIGAAKGLEYLHGFGIVHRDVKPANILLDDNMQAKVADFGLAREGQGTAASTRVMGTPGYVDPAYTITRNATTTTDLYSFGILVLVMLSGKNATISTAEQGNAADGSDGSEAITIIQWARKLKAEGNVSPLKDPCMEAPDDIITRMVQLAITCTAMPTASRPSMSRVAQDLEGLRAEVGGGDARAEAAAMVDKILASTQIERSFEEELAMLEGGQIGTTTTSVIE